MLAIHRRFLTTATTKMSQLFQGVTLVNTAGDKRDGAECLQGKVSALYFAVSPLLHAIFTFAWRVGTKY